MSKTPQKKMLKTAIVCVLIVAVAGATMVAATSHIILKRNKKKKHLRNYAQKLQYIQSQIQKGVPFTRMRSNHTYRNGSNIQSGQKVDMSVLTDVIAYDEENNTVDVEANTKVNDVIQYLLQRGANITCCPDLAQLSVAGLVCGVGGGNQSFKYGYFHSNVVDADILLSDGAVLNIDSSHELMQGCPRSIGTLGYLTRVKLRTEKVLPYVESTQEHFDTAEAFFERIREIMDSETIKDGFSFLDGVVFSGREFVLIHAKYVSSLPKGSRLTNVANDEVYYEIIRTQTKLYFDVFSFVYRWQTDLYFTSMSTPSWLKSKWLRRLIPKKMVGHVHTLLSKVMPVEISMFCSDIMISQDKAPKFFNYYNKSVGVYPLYICPVSVPKERQMATFWPDDITYIDFGCGYGVLPDDKSEHGQKKLCAEIERAMIEHGGIKLPYTDTFLDQEEFETSYFQNHDLYLQLRKKYGFTHFKTVYEKRQFTV